MPPADQTDLDIAAVLGRGRPRSAARTAGGLGRTSHGARLGLAGVIVFAALGISLVVSGDLSPSDLRASRPGPAVSPLNADVAVETTKTASAPQAPSIESRRPGRRVARVTTAMALPGLRRRGIAAGPRGRLKLAMRDARTPHLRPKVRGVRAAPASAYARLEPRFGRAAAGPERVVGPPSQPGLTGSHNQGSLKFARAERSEALDAIWILRQK